MTARLIGGPPPPPGQQVGNVARILDLAGHFANPVPGRQDPAAGVTERVRRDLADREPQVIHPRPAEPSRLGVAGRDLADLTEVVGEGQRLGVGRRWRQGGVAAGRHASRSEIPGTVQPLPAQDHRRMGQLDVAERLSAQRTRVVQAEQRQRLPGERQVGERFVPGDLAQLG